MTKLKILYLRNNNLKDISAINSLTNLTCLYIDGENNNVELKQIEDILSSIEIHVNSQTLSTLVNCTPSKITALNFWNNGTNGAEFPDLSNFTALTYLNLGRCNIPNLDVISNIASLEELNLDGFDRHGKLAKLDFSKLTNLYKLILTYCQLWTEDLKNLTTLKNNESLEINLSTNALIDPEILLELPSKFKINLWNNVNISESFKARLREHFGKNVSF